MIILLCVVWVFHGLACIHLLNWIDRAAVVERRIRSLVLASYPAFSPYCFEDLQLCFFDAHIQDGPPKHLDRLPACDKIAVGWRDLSILRVESRHICRVAPPEGNHNVLDAGSNAITLAGGVRAIAY